MIRQSIVQFVRVQKSLVKILAPSGIRLAQPAALLCFEVGKNLLSYSIDTKLQPAYPFRLFLAGVSNRGSNAGLKAHETHIPAE